MRARYAAQASPLCPPPTTMASRMRMARAEGYCFAVQTSKEEGSAVDLALSAEDRDLQERAREFTARYLLPFEDECERNDGLSADSLAEIRAAVLEWRFNAMNHRVEDGGQGFDLFSQVLIEEQWGRATGALWDVPGGPRSRCVRGRRSRRMSTFGRRRGERRDAYAITEEQARSDPSMVRTTAVRRGTWVLKGEVARHHRRRGRLPPGARAGGWGLVEGRGVLRGQGPARRSTGPYAQVHAPVRVRAPDLRPGGRAGRWRQAAGGGGRRVRG